MGTANALRFTKIIDELLVKQTNSGYERELSSLLEYASGSLFHDIRKGYWYDGVTEMRVSKRKQRQLEIKGQMWVAQDSNRQWQEPLFARVTDKRITKQGVWLKVKIGEYEADGELRDVL